MKCVKYPLKTALSTAFLKKIKNFLLKTNNSPKPYQKLQMIAANAFTLTLSNSLNYSFTHDL